MAGSIHMYLDSHSRAGATLLPLSSLASWCRPKNGSEGRFRFFMRSPASPSTRPGSRRFPQVEERPRSLPQLPEAVDAPQDLPPRHLFWLAGFGNRGGGRPCWKEQDSSSYGADARWLAPSLKGIIKLSALTDRAHIDLPPYFRCQLCLAPPQLPAADEKGRGAREILTRESRLLPSQFYCAVQSTRWRGRKSAPYRRVA